MYCIGQSILNAYMRVCHLKKTFSTSKTFRLLQLFRKPLKWKNPMNASSQHKSVGGFLLPPIKEIKTSTSHKKEANKMITKQRRESPFGQFHLISNFSSPSYSKVEAAWESQIKMQLTKTVRPDMEFVKWHKSNYPSREICWIQARVLAKQL